MYEDVSNLRNKHDEQPLRAGHQLNLPCRHSTVEHSLYLHITQRPTQGAQLFRPLLSQVKEISLSS